MIEFRVITVTNNLEEYPEYRKDTEEFPETVKCVEDEVEVFVVGAGDFWPAREFFFCVNINHFIVDSSEELL